MSEKKPPFEPDCDPAEQPTLETQKVAIFRSIAKSLKRLADALDQIGIKVTSD